VEIPTPWTVQNWMTMQKSYQNLFKFQRNK
jgi:hypothetical protein